MLVKLALGNVRKSLRDYAIYFVTIALGVAVFYAFNTLSGQADFLSGQAAGMLRTVGDIMAGLTVFLAVVLGFLMVYANNYLVRRRKREFGLYQVLGMRRRHVSAVMAIETFTASVVSFAVGILLGILLSQLLVFVSAALFQDQVTYFTFQFSPYAFGLTLGCFAVMFAVMLLFNLRTIGKVRLVELMQGDRVNEDIKIRNMPLAVTLFLVGLVLIVWAYVRLLRDGLPVTEQGDESLQFLITTVMVTVGTLLFFYALSGFLLSLVRRLRGVYWSGLNMFTLRQLNARINTASISMAVISLILFLAITSVTGGMGICGTMNASVQARAPYDGSVAVSYFGESMLHAQPPQGEDGEVKPGYTVAKQQYDILEMLAAAGYDLSAIGNVAQARVADGAALVDDPSSFSMDAIVAQTGVTLPPSLASAGSGISLDVLGVSDFNALRGLLGLAPVELADDEYLVTTDMGGVIGQFFTDVVAAGWQVEIAGRVLKPADGAAAMVGELSSALMNSPMGSNGGTVVVADDIAAQGEPYMTYLNVMYTVPREEGDAYLEKIAKLDTSGIFVEDGKQFAYTSTWVTPAEAYASTVGMTALIAYMAIYIGFVLVISCAAILAIQQLSEASDSQRRYRLLSELGCPTRLIYRSLLVQTLVYFLFPLIIGLSHSIVALFVVTDVVALFGSLDITGAAITSAGLFVVAYGGYLLVTYRVARGMAHQSVIAAR